MRFVILIYGGTSIDLLAYVFDNHLLGLFQNLGRFDFSKYIVFVMCLDMTYIEMHSKMNVSRKIKTAYVLKQREYI